MERTITLPQTRAALPADAGAQRPVAAWLLVCCALVFAMVIVGGVTRLTQSGLSIVEWEPIAGAIPPLAAADWEQLFKEYQATPQYRRMNYGMTLAQFKGIFWWEYVHRLMGRAIGIAFLVPFLWFLWRRKIDRALAWRLGAIFLLGALQGAVGWWMVKSGLIDDPRVSHVRLSIHLGLAFLIFAAMFWTALGLLAPRQTVQTDPNRRRLTAYASALCALVFLMVLSGALVAGTRAGLAYNTFPLMNGEFFPRAYFQLEPWWENLLHNMAAVQFNHRLIAWLLVVLIPAFWWAARRVELGALARLAVNLLLGMLFVQLALGAAHQTGAFTLFALAMWTAHEVRREAAGVSRKEPEARRGKE